MREKLDFNLIESDLDNKVYVKSDKIYLRGEFSITVISSLNKIKEIATILPCFNPAITFIEDSLGVVDLFIEGITLRYNFKNPDITYPFSGVVDWYEHICMNYENDKKFTTLLKEIESDINVISTCKHVLYCIQTYSDNNIGLDSKSSLNCGVKVNKISHPSRKEAKTGCYNKPIEESRVFNKCEESSFEEIRGKDTPSKKNYIHKSSSKHQVIKLFCSHRFEEIEDKVNNFIEENSNVYYAKNTHLVYEKQVWIMTIIFNKLEL